MDWIDPRYASMSDSSDTEEATPGSSSKGKTRGKSKKSVSSKRAATKKSGKPLSTQVTAALAQPLDVWSVAYDHAISRLKWPSGCSPESTLLWSAVMQEQAEVLVRAGMSAKKLAAIVSDKPSETLEEQAEQIGDVVDLMGQSLESLAFQWLDSADAYPHAALAIAALAWHIPDHARRPGNEWLSQWMKAVTDRMATYKPDDEASVMCHLVVQCELPLLVGVATAASKRVVLTEASRAMDSLALYIEQSEDNADPWLQHGATYLRAALASVLRCRVLANSLGLRKWFPPQQKALAQLIEHAARWCRPDGTHLLGAGQSAPKAKSIWAALASQTKKPKAMSAAMTLSGIGEGKKSEVRRKVSAGRLPALTFYSEEAACACMQSDWRTKDGRVAIDFSDADICIEALGPKGHAVLAGQWTTQVEVAGQAQLQLDEWQELCWFSDDDVDYLELEAKFGQHARVQRQATLFREDRLLLLADTLISDTDAKLSIRSQLPLAAETHFDAAKKTTEGIIKTEGGKCLTLPIYLPEWRRSLSMAGSQSNLTSDGENLVAYGESTGNRLYMPTIISLCNSHARQKFTWRHLTVAEELRIVRHDEARAFRVQVGADQWFLYRNLAKPVRRTAMSLHTLADFYAARFDREDAEFDTLVEVEAESTS